MIPYFALIFIPLFLQVILKVSRKQVLVGNRGSIIRAENIALPTFFALFFLLLALRDDTIGRDLPNYHNIFSFWGWRTLQSVFAEPSELLFHLYCWFVYNCISEDFQVFLAITAALSIIPIAYVYNQDKSHGYLKIAIFVNMSTFIMLFSGIRQGLAMSFGLLAYQALKDKKTWRFILWSIVAILIHHTGFMVLLFYPLCRIRFQKRDLIWLTPCYLGLLVFNRPIFNLISAIIGAYNEKYITIADSTGAFGSFLLFTLFAVFCYIVEDEERMDDEAFALRNILSFAVALQSFASLNTLAMRLNYYFILLIPIALGQGIRYAKPKYAQVAKFAEFVISAYFTLIFITGIYRSYITGISTLDTIPYIPFWKG